MEHAAIKFMESCGFIEEADTSFMTLPDIVKQDDFNFQTFPRLKYFLSAGTVLP